VYGPPIDQPTRCPGCDRVVITRGDGPSQISGIDGDRCEACESPLGVRASLFRRAVRYESSGERVAPA
jgi:hypothetical protein